MQPDDTAPAPPPAPGAAHLPALDAVRGLAILAVLLHHLAVYSPGNDTAGRIYASFAEFGSHGVDLFFALSGYLLVRAFADAPATQGWAGRFWLRRFAKIVPLYALTLLVVFFALPVLLTATGFGARIAAPAALHSEWPWHAAFASHWLYFNLSDWGYPLLIVAWSLGVEVEFYLLLCLAVVFGWVRSPRFWIGLALVALASRAIGVAVGWNWIRILTFLPGRLDAFAAGALVALRPGWFGAPLRLAGAAVLLVPVCIGWSRENTWVQLFGYTWVALGAAALIRFATSPHWKRAVPTSLGRALAFLGLVSYSIYLTHIILRSGIRDIFLPKDRVLSDASAWATWLAYVVVATLVMVLVGWLVWLLIERPAQRFLLSRFGPPRPLDSRPASTP